MKKLTLLFLPFFCLLFSCHREPPKQFSYWYIGTDSFTSNNVTVENVYPDPQRGGDNVVALKGMGKSSFVITFYNRVVFPDNGFYPIATASATLPLDSEVQIDIYYTGSEYKYYIPSPSSTTQLSASLVNGKVQLVLPPTWFINYFNPNDSALIHGVFNQP